MNGESPQRLGALAGGYANLGLLHRTPLACRTQDIQSPGLVMSQRMVARDSRGLGAMASGLRLRPGRAAPIGVGRPANGRRQQWQAANGHLYSWSAARGPAWVDLIDAYCRFAHASSKRAAREGAGKRPRPGCYGSTASGIPVMRGSRLSAALENAPEAAGLLPRDATPFANMAA